VLAIAMGVPLARVAFGEAPSDRAVTEQILASVGSNRADARGPVDEAKKALERAAGARRSGDVRHAELLEGLALEWAETARDVIRASAVEADAGALGAAAADAGLKAERARALLEESIARRGRAEAELEKLTADGGILPTTKPGPASSAKSKPAAGPKAAPSNSAAAGPKAAPSNSAAGGSKPAPTSSAGAPKAAPSSSADKKAP
jgi:hypothetical protein